jgi:hypothetical protein
MACWAILSASVLLHSYIWLNVLAAVAMWVNSAFLAQHLFAAIVPILWWRRGMQRQSGR